MLPDFRGLAAIWLQKGHGANRVRWLAHLADRIEKDGVSKIIETLHEGEMQVFLTLLQGRDPFTSLPAATIKAFDESIR